MAELLTTAETERPASTEGLAPTDKLTRRFFTWLIHRLAWLVENLPDWFKRPILRSRTVPLLLGVTVICFCAARAYVGLVGSRIYSHDAFWLLDGAWRLLNGQRAQVDFSSMQGVLAFLPATIGLWISGGTIWGFGYAQALMGVVLTIWMYLLGRNRLADVPLALMCLAVCFMAAAPFSLNESPFMLGPGMTYNRYGYCLLTLVAVEAVFEMRARSTKSDFFGGLSTGVLVISLFFLKVTFFVSAACLVICLLPCRTLTRPRWLGICIGFGASLFGFLIYYSFSIRPIFADLYITAASRKVPYTSFQLDQLAGHALVLIALSLGIGALAARSGEILAARTALVAGFVLTACAVLTGLGNYNEYSGLAMSPFVAIILTDLLLRPTRTISTADRTATSTILMALMALVSTVVIAGAISMGYGLYKRVFVYKNLVDMQAPRLRGFATDDLNSDYTPFVNDGVNLLMRFRRPGETIMSLDFSNPFSYGLGIKPAPGGASGLQFNNSFNDKHHKSPEALLGAADLLMWPKDVWDNSLQFSVPRIYGPYVDTHFHLIGETDHWRLYRHN